MGKFLDKNQKQQLEAELRRERGRKHADRIRVILLLDKGETYTDIAKFLFLDEGTIANYRRRFKEGGLEELLSDDYKGSASFLSLDDQIELEAHLQETVYLSVKSMLEYVKKRFKDFCFLKRSQLSHQSLAVSF
jgi:transposase